MLNRLSLAVAVGLVTTLAHVCPAPIVSKDILRQYFLTGDKPTESQFASFIDSALNLEIDFGDTIADHLLALDNGGLASINNLASVLPLGAEVGPGLTYTTQGVVGDPSAWPGSDGFIGVQFELDNPGGPPTTHYGYIQLSVDSATAPTPYAIHLVGFAYETDPDTPVTTADIPEPVSVALMITACVGLLGRRKARTPGTPG